jgi:hypothetical protein
VLGSGRAVSGEIEVRPPGAVAGHDRDEGNDVACFGAALAGYVEATLEDDAEKNRLCPPAPFSNTTADWGRQQVLGSRASSFTSYPAIRDWADGISLNPGRIPPELAGSAAGTAAQKRLAKHVGPGMAKLSQLAGMA